jgi:hypothetical protein
MLVVALAAVVLGIRTSLYKELVEPGWWDTDSLKNNFSQQPYVVAYPHLWFGITVAFACLLLVRKPPRRLVVVALSLNAIILLSWLMLRRRAGWGPGGPAFWPDDVLFQEINYYNAQGHACSTLEGLLSLHCTHSAFELADLGFLIATFVVLWRARSETVPLRIRSAVGLLGTVFSLLYWLVHIPSPVSRSTGIRGDSLWPDLAVGMILLGALLAIVTSCVMAAIRDKCRLSTSVASGATGDQSARRRPRCARKLSRGLRRPTRGS